MGFSILGSCKKEKNLTTKSIGDLQKKLIDFGPWSIPVNDNTNTQIGYMVWEFSENQIKRNGYDMDHKVNTAIYPTLIKSYIINDSLIISEIHSTFSKPMQVMSIDSNQVDFRFTNGYDWVFDAFNK